MQTRRNFVKTLTGAVGIASAELVFGGCNLFQKEVEFEKAAMRYDTIAHDFLDIEMGFGVTDSDYRNLDDIIYEAQKRINKIKLDKPFTKYTKEEATTTLKIIGSTLDDWGFEYQSNLLLNVGLKSKKIDCDSYAVIYLGIADILKLPLKAVTAPSHLFIRWHFDENNYFNWETTSAEGCPDEMYKAKLKIPEESIENYTYLQSLSREETYSIAYINLASNLHLLGDFEGAVKNYDKSIELYPKCPEAYNNKGAALHDLEEYGEAIENYNRALELNPYRPKAHNNKGFTLHCLGEYEKAIEEYDCALELDPDFVLARNNRRISLNKLKELEKSKTK